MHARRRAYTRMHSRCNEFIDRYNTRSGRSAQRCARAEHNYAIALRNCCTAHIVAGFSLRVQNAPGRPSDIGVAHRGNGTHLLHIVARAVYHDEGHESRFVHASLSMWFSSRVRICAWICLRRAFRCDHPAIWKLIATRIIDAICKLTFRSM